MKRKRNASPMFSEVTASAGRSSGYRYALTQKTFEEGFYEQLRSQVPVIDAALGKLVRLTGGYSIVCENENTERMLNEYFSQMPVSISGSSLDTFVQQYLDSLLTYGRAVGEIILSERTHGIAGLYCADCTQYKVRTLPDGSYEVRNIFTDSKMKCEHPERLLYSVLNPSPKDPEGRSLLRGLPVFSDILLRIFETVGQNFDRAGNVRYAVTYKPTAESAGFGKERAEEIARQWAEGMNASKAGNIKDFVAVGDVDIKVIGADGPILGTEVPVRQILEQMISKLSIPPFMLGLSWSTTERMSSQQADILTSEIDYYRRVLTAMMKRIISLHCQMCGIDERVDIVWDNVNLQDEESLARARLYNAQAEETEIRARREADE
ncbi:MAG: serine/threonine protein phosphatase [Ruminococcus sp.]|nr:serine/threonine protein phosphatase [Ruminococcus sp.]